MALKPKFKLNNLKLKSLKLNKKPKDPNQKGIKFLLLKKIILVLLVLELIGGAFGLSYLVYVLKDAPSLNVEDFVSQNSSKIFDSNGVLIADVGYQIRENISYDDLPQTVIDAFVSIEDSRFFEHNGFDLPRFTKAFIDNIRTMSIASGGSTFTMQLVKGTYFETEEATAVRSGLAGINRKLREIYTAINSENLLSKKRILELYLNRLNFGVPGNKRGIQTAAQYYFGKDITDVNLSEAAFLAGVINAPTYYNPMNNLDLAQERTNTVLYQMERHGYISNEEYELALTTNLENLLVGSTSTSDQSIPYQAYVDVVVNEVMELTGMDPVDVPMRIYTTMDRNTQDTVDAIQNGEVDGVVWPNEIIQTGIVSMNNQTGEIIAIGGGRFYDGERLYNRAVDMTRQPGSSAKVVLTYPLAFENLGWSTQHMLEDMPIKYEGIDVIIKNWDNIYRGDVLLPSALGNSLNIPAIQTLTSVVNTIGTTKVVEYMNAIGFTDVTTDTFDIGYGIGGSTFEASPSQMAGAVSTMINGGEYITPHTVTRIEFLDGTEPITPSYSSTAVISDAAAYMTTMMMEQDVSGPYSNFMQILRRNFQVYAKTGTSDWGDTGVEYGIPAGAAKDKWMVASTSEFTTAVWVGYDKAVVDQISYLDRAQINLNLPGRINNAILNSIYEDRSAPAIVSRPSSVVDVTHVMGVYPYVAPNENTNPELVVSGLIKSEYANLSPLAAPSIANPSSLSASVSASGTSKTFTFTMNEYPDASKLTVAPTTKDYSLTVANQTVTATGTRLFDYSWIYGPVKYKLKIYVDDKVVQELKSDSSTFTSTLTVADTSTVKGCAYYSYDFVSFNSSEICQTIALDDLYLTIPDFTGKTKEEFTTFMEANSLKYTVTTSYPAGVSSSLIGKISTVTTNPASASSSIEKSKLSQYTFTANVVDKNVSLYEDFVGKSASIRPSYCSIVTCTGPSSGTITSVKYGNTTATANNPVKLSTIVSSGNVTYTAVNSKPKLSDAGIALIITDSTDPDKDRLLLTSPKGTTVYIVDPDNDSLAYSIQQGIQGTVTINETDGSFIFVPAAGVTNINNIFSVTATDTGNESFQQTYVIRYTITTN